MRYQNRIHKASPHLAPNILIILLDTATANLLSCYGRYKNTTPCFDRLAREGMRFSHAYANGAWTPPSHASLFTGLPCIAHGITHDNIDVNRHRIFDDRQWAPEMPTIAGTLSENGYDTLGVCKNVYVGSRSNICRGFDVWVQDHEQSARIIRNMTGEKPHRNPNTTNILYWMDEKRDRSRPWFCFVNFWTPHLPRRPGTEFRNRFIKGPVPRYLHDIDSGNCFEYLWNGILAKRDINTFVKLYVALAAQVDAEVEEMRIALERRGLLDNTIIFFVSDHGDENGEHNLVDHQLCVYNTLIRIPMIVWGPGRIPRGRVVGKNAQMLDIFPTVLDFAGLGAVRRKLSLPGMNLVTEVPYLSRERLIVSEYGVPNIIVSNMGKKVAPAVSAPFLRRLKCAVEGEWKYIWASDGRDELYNVINDPGEEHTCIARQAKRAAALKRKLAAWCTSFGNPLKRDGLTDGQRLTRAEELFHLEADRKSIDAYDREWGERHSGWIGK